MPKQLPHLFFYRMYEYRKFLLKLNYLLIPKHFLFFIFFIFYFTQVSTAQLLLPANTNPRVVYTCGNACTNIQLQAAQVKTSTDYTFKQVPYQHYSYNNPNGFEDSTFYDALLSYNPMIDGPTYLYSNAVNMPFPICFYDSIYTSFVLNSTGLVSFDISKANCEYYSYTDVPLPSACYTTTCLNSGAIL